MTDRIWLNSYPKGVPADIDASKYASVVEMMEESFKKFADGYVPNIADWVDAQVRNIFATAVNREVDLAVVTPGLETPLFMSKPVMSVLGQFRRFAASATTRIMLANLQKADATALMGLIASVGAGMMGAKVYSVVAGRDTSEYRSQDWIKEGISRAGVMGWLDEFNAFTAKATGGQVDYYRLIGADKPLSRYSSRSALSGLFGPTMGKAESLVQVSRALATGEASQADLRAARRLIPLQNLFYTRWLFDQVEKSGADILDLPEKRQ